MGSRLTIARKPNCDLSPIGFAYIAMNIEGASARWCDPLPATETFRVEPIFVYRRNAVPMNIHMEPSSPIFIFANIGEESGFQAVPDASRFMGSPTLVT